MENYPSSTSSSDILWDIYCEDYEKEHLNPIQTANGVALCDDDDDDSDSLANGLAW